MRLVVSLVVVVGCFACCASMALFHCDRDRAFGGDDDADVQMHVAYTSLDRYDLCSLPLVVIPMLLLVLVKRTCWSTVVQSFFANRVFPTPPGLVRMRHASHGFPVTEETCSVADRDRDRTVLLSVPDPTRKSHSRNRPSRTGRLLLLIHQQRRSHQ